MSQEDPVTIIRDLFESGQAEPPPPVIVRPQPKKNVNVEMNSMVLFPSNYTECPKVKITWSDNYNQRTAEYISFYGHIEHDRDPREVLVFVATEFLSENYRFLARSLIPRVNKEGPQNAPQIKVTPEWQYGEISATERFLVYHPKERRIFARRFLTANSTTHDTLDDVAASGKDLSNKAIIAAATGWYGLLALTAAPTVEKGLWKIGSTYLNVNSYLKEFV